MVKYKKISCTLASFLLAVSAPLFAKSNQPLLVIDADAQTVVPKKMRTTSDALPVDAHINQTGLNQLHLIGSAQFSATSLQKVMQQLKLQRVTIVDLRQESHGYLNEEAISWYGLHDAANADKSTASIMKDEAKRLDALQHKEIATVHLILDKTEDGVIQKTKRLKIKVDAVRSEETLAQQYQLGYHRLYVQDFHAPSENEVDHFIELMKQRASDEWLYFHCRGGSGRTTEFMAMVDMMQNAKTVSFDDILERQAALGGKDLRELPPEDSYKYPAAVERLAFLKTFYQYCQTNTDHYKTRWSDYLK